MTYTLRPFHPGDENIISEIHFQSKDYFEEEYLRPEFIAECEHRNDFKFIVAVNEDKIVGFTGVHYQKHVGRAEIGPICVITEQKGLGIGSQLIDKTLQTLQEGGIHRVMALIKSNNLAAKKFFMKKKFTEEAEFEKYTKNGESVVQLVKFLI